MLGTAVTNLMQGYLRLEDDLMNANQQRPNLLADPPGRLMIQLSDLDRRIATYKSDGQKLYRPGSKTIFFWDPSATRRPKMHAMVGTLAYDLVGVGDRACVVCAKPESYREQPYPGFHHSEVRSTNLVSWTNYQNV